VLVVAGPTVHLDSSALGSVRAFMQAGGSALVLLDPVVFGDDAPTAIPVVTGLDALLEERGVHFDRRLVFDLASNQPLTLRAPDGTSVMAPYPLWPITIPAGESAITRGLAALTLAWAGSLQITDTSAVTAILQTSAAAGLRDLQLPITPDQEWNVPPDQLGVRTVAAAIGVQPDAAGQEPRGRIVVVSDASFLDRQFTDANPHNLVFFANAIDWLSQDESLMRIRSKSRQPPPLILPSDGARAALKWGNLVGVPLLFVLAGLVRVTGRRRRSIARWSGMIP
jgi:ABC-type uncharacterized transport system involved in gliding motility auxiliary subunit